MILPKIWLKHYSIKTKLMIFLRKEIQTAVNQLLEAELTAFFRPMILMQKADGTLAIPETASIIARLIRSLARSKFRFPETETANFISTLCLTTSSTRTSWKA
ncbi:transposase [Lactobacillus helveticus R0052]|nr:transposase [Lactobacillus helveticus R0052]